MIRVVGIGNELRRDDGVGPVVARALAASPLPDGVRVDDYGSRVVHLAFDLVDAEDLVVVVDAAELDAPAGTVAVVAPDLASNAPAVGVHGLDLRGVATMVEQLGGTLDQVVLVGCQPADTSEGIGLSRVVEEAVPHAVATVRTLVEQRLRGRGSIVGESGGR